MKKLKIAQQLAKENLSEAQKKQKKYYDNKTEENNFEIGDQVYLTEESIPKERTEFFYRKWTGPYRIIDQIGDNLYEIKQSQSEKSIIVHSNRLKFCLEERPWNNTNTTDQRSQTKKTTDPGSHLKRKKSEINTKNNKKQKTIKLPEDLLPDDLTQFIFDYEKLDNINFDLDENTFDSEEGQSPKEINHNTQTDTPLTPNDVQAKPEEERSKLRSGLRKKSVLKKKVMFDI